MNWSEYPYLRIAISFAFGIFATEYFDLNVSIIYGFTALIIFIYVGTSVFLTYKFTKSHISGSLFILLFLFLGMAIMSFRKYTDTNKIIGTETNKKILLTGIIKENLKSESKQRFLISTESYSKSDSLNLFHSCDLIVQFEKTDSVATTYKVGNQIAFNAKLSLVKSASNPESFDYAAFLKTKGIFQQAFVKEGYHHLISTNQFNAFKTFAETTKTFTSSTLHKYISNQSSLGIAEALLLGQKTYLSSDTYQDFADTGAIHVLSVSGLHVAIFISLFIWLFDKIKSKHQGVKFIRVISLILIVAFYVVLTGMSPSVLRAGFMVILYIVGKNYFKNTNTYNILSISAICLLCYDPYYLFQISFQLSYLSLLSILYFQPKIKKWWLPKSKVLQFIWDLINVSLAAQVLVFPLTILYFNKFPLYFILSGIIAVPLVTVLIYLGTFIFVIEFICSGFNEYISPIFNALLDFLQFAISYLADLPYSKLDSLWLDPYVLILCYISILLFMIWLELRQYKFIASSLVATYLVILSIHCRPVLMSQKDSLFIYDVYGGVLIDIFSNYNVQTIRSSTVSEKTINFVALNNRIKNSYELRNKFNSSLDSIHLFKLKNKYIYVLDGEQDIKRLISDLNLDVLVISKSKVSSPEYVLAKLNPKIVILDKNVPPWIIKKWETYSDNHLFKLHNVKKDGAYCAFF